MKSKKLLIIAFVLCLLTVYSQHTVVASPDNNPEYVSVIPIKGIINRGMAAFVERGIREAEEGKAKALVFEISTPGGEIGSAVQISKAILNTSIPTVSFINSEATSAGVIIAISADTITAVPGATIGAAETRPNEEKYISYWSSALRSTAETTGRDPELVAAMADADVVIEGVKEKGKILSLTTGEALELGLIDRQISNINELIKEMGILENPDLANIFVQQMSFLEKISHFATNPYIAPFLLTIGIVGTVVEILTPGFGIPGMIGLIAFGLFFGGNILAGATSFWVLGLFILGILLLLIEVFIPGFGFFGIAGIFSIFGSVIMAFPNIEQALISILVSLIISSVIIYFMVKYLIKAPLFDRIILGTKQEISEGYTVSDKDLSHLTGVKGKAITSLRPAGAAMINEKKYDVLTEGEFVPKDSEIIVVRVEGSKIIVKKI